MGYRRGRPPKKAEDVQPQPTESRIPEPVKPPDKPGKSPQAVARERVAAEKLDWERGKEVVEKYYIVFKNKVRLQRQFKNGLRSQELVGMWVRPQGYEGKKVPFQFPDGAKVYRRKRVKGMELSADDLNPKNRRLE